jgi:hypothetical protein
MRNAQNQTEEEEGDDAQKKNGLGQKIQILAVSKGAVHHAEGAAAQIQQHGMSVVWQ